MTGTLIDATTGERRGPGELSARAAQLCSTLSRRGVRPGDRVGVLCHNRIEVFELLAACQRMRTILVPLNWRLAVSELAEVVEDADPIVVFAEPDLLDTACALGRPATSLDEVAPAPEIPQALATGAWRDQPAMLLYTSGTTGRPKGVMISWRQIEFNARATAATLDLTRRDRCLAFLPLFHTGGLHALATPVLTVGGSVVLMHRFDAEHALDLMEHHDITCVIAVPTIYQMLLDAGLSGRSLPALKHLLLGGASPLPELFDDYRSAGHQLVHGYGLTEAGPNCFAFGRHTPHSVGLPMPGTEAALASDGELLLRGPHVCLGYWDKPEQSQQLLGIGAAEFPGWLRTGDIARRLDDGTYTIAGRKKEIYISGGENVYPAEVERVLASHPGVAEVCVIGVPDRRWGEVGAAAVVPRDGRTQAVNTLDSFARQHLAKFKVPKHWHLVPALPKGATGKILRSELARELRAMEIR